MDGPDYERQHWQQINDLFVAAQARPLEERRAFLKQACADQPDLQAEVESLLFAYDASDDFLHKINLDEAVALLESVGEPVSPGQQIGPYRVVRELGRGGMGAVYLAHRADGQFDQQVALKLIKRGIDSEAILYRFLHERQILARLQHAHIARLLDGGVSADGRPYFAMEYVAGVPLTDYCDAHRLDVEARLRLFEQVCRAVHYAHTNLVVHRDLKPSNMLVTEEGELKLLDFGIAKLLDEEASVKTMTEAGLRVMTPEYAAPEQMQGETVTTATDIYALGVVLYELLTGHRPYQFDRRTPAAVAHVMAEAEPVRPSTVVSQTTELRFGDGMGTTKTITPQDVSQARSTQPERLQRRLRGDLDIVVLKALRKEPERRYASAEALVEDIRRHLAGLPVVAQQDTMDYRMRKFVRRHRVGVLAAGLVVAALVAGLTVALWQARVARQEATKAEVVQAFMLSLFKTSNPDKAKGETITARELLDAGATRVEVELANQPEVQAEMMAVVGKVYQQLGLYEPARPLLEQALARRRAVLGENHEDVAASLHDLASLLQSTGDYAAAESLYRETLTLQRKLLGHQHTTVATTLNNLASLLFDQGDYDAAEGLFREALALRQKLLGPEHPDIAISLNDLALVLYYNGDYDAAEPLFYEALAMQRKLLGPEHTDLAMTLN
ncbi:MAG TPA: serine/threonine-protein kinase, partial [Rhodothermales bacterium]|nr:serine/threonine-protein kinase [Rhodothermales bacterium]